MRTFNETLSSSSKDPLPPRIYVIGCLTNNPKVLIKIADYEYTLDDPFTGFDVFFKIGLGMNFKYPRQSMTAWVFVENFIYNQKVNTVNNSQLITIINEMNTHLKNQLKAPGTSKDL